jgi:hypothetical protein
MDDDIGPILQNWKFQEGDLTVRKVAGRDGREKIQLRLDLGLLQMEAEGRPDGKRPFGKDSLLDHFRTRAETYRAKHGWYEGFELKPRDCQALQRESLQYYHRRLSLLRLQDYSAAAADADHNLEILDLLKAFAARRDDWLASEQYRAFILSQRAQALALLALEQGDTRAALAEIDRGAEAIRRAFAEQGHERRFRDSPEALFLEDLRQQIQEQRRDELRQRLDHALQQEDYDAAAALRAEIRDLED